MLFKHKLNILRRPIDPQRMFLACGASFKHSLQLSWYSKNARHEDMGVFGKAIHMSVVDLNILNERYVEKGLVSTKVIKSLFKDRHTKRIHHILSFSTYIFQYR